MLKRRNPYGLALMRIGVIVLIALYLIFFAIPRRLKTIKSPSAAVELPPEIYGYEDNTIVYQPAANLSERFNRMVERAYRGHEPLTILHIGDSHIQADFFTGEVRQLLSSWLGDDYTSRGFTFPFQVAGSNNPEDYSITSQGEWRVNKFNDTTETAYLGIAGIALTTRDPSARLSIRLHHGEQRFQRFDIINIFYGTNGMDVVPRPTTPSQMVKQGDGHVSYRLNEPVDSITIELAGQFSPKGRLSIFGFDLQNSRAKLIYHAVGVNGANVRTHLRSRNFGHGLSHLNPQVVIVSLGTNDAYSDAFNVRAFGANLLLLVSKIQQVLPHSLVILTTPGDHLINREKPNEALEQIRAEVYRIAGEMNCGIWDFYQIMGGAGSINTWAEMGMCANDKLHFNSKGYRLQGALLYSALVKLSQHHLPDERKSPDYE